MLTWDAMETITEPYKKIAYNTNLLQDLFQNIITCFFEFGGKTRFLDFNRNTCFVALIAKIRFCGKIVFTVLTKTFVCGFGQNSIFAKNSILRFWQKNSILRFWQKELVAILTEKVDLRRNF